MGAHPNRVFAVRVGIVNTPNSIVILRERREWKELRQCFAKFKSSRK